MKNLWIKLQRKFKYLKLYHALMLTFISIFLSMVLLIAATSAIITGRINMKNYSTYTSQFLQELTRNLEHIVNDVESTSRYIISENLVQELLLAEPVGTAYSELMRDTKQEIIRLNMERNYIESVSIYDFKGNGFTAGRAPSYISEFDVLKSQVWYEDVLEKKGKYQWNNTSFSGPELQADRIVFGRVINAADAMSGLGILVITLENDYLSEMLYELSDPTIGHFYITNIDGELLFPLVVQDEETKSSFHQIARLSLAGDNFFRQGNQYISTYYLEHLNWHLICTTDVGTVLQSQWINFFIIFLVSIIAIILSFFIYHKFSHGITREVHLLADVMERASERGYTEEIAIGRIDEFMRLGESYNRLTNRTNILINQVMQEKLNTKQAQLESLQAQINPHFLYNTLDCISWEAMAHGQPDISHMIHCLSKMFRFSLGKGESEVPLSREVENVRNYLTLQKRRFEDKLVYVIDIPEQMMSYRVMKFLLQPLVENSILHGLQARNGTGYIGIMAEDKGDSIVISVVDSGVGIVEEKVKKILDGDTEDKEKKRHRHGIYNVNERLKMRYGPESQLKFENRNNGGTRVSIRLFKSELGG